MPYHIANRNNTFISPRNIYVYHEGSWVTVDNGYVYSNNNFNLHYISETVVTAPNNWYEENVKDLFEAAEPGVWNSNKRKRLVVSGSRGPLVINSSPTSSLTIEVTQNGIISGYAGIPNSGGGGNALNITAGTGITLINNGIIRSGGGAGGRGGDGGSGYYYTYPYEGPYFIPPGEIANSGYYWLDSNQSYTTIVWNSNIIYSGPGYYTSYTYGGWTYYRSTHANGNFFYIYRQYTQTNYTSGGIGGGGGYGQGINYNKTTGSAGSGGGTNAGNGGRGGDGGDWGSPGATGSNGGNGNYGGGTHGSTGGTPGFSIRGYNRVIYSGSGILLGSTFNT